MSGRVRPLEERDIARVVELHAQVFGKSADGSPPSLPELLPRILLHHPWRDESLPSLVYEDDDGDVVGHLGVMPRPMSFKGRRINAAVSHSFLVEPGKRSALAALELAREFLSGPQDLSLAEGNEASRRIWEKTGGAVSLLHSLCWTRPLKPGRYALSLLRKRGLGAGFERALRPLCQLADAVVPSAAPRVFRLPAPPLAGDGLDAGSLGAAMSKCASKRSLRPRYDERSLDWLLQMLAEKTGRGSFRKVIVRNPRGEVAGWYLYYRNTGGIGVVAQLGARDGCADAVLQHLLHDASRHGVVAVSGQVDPGLFPAYARNNCLFHHDGGSWILVHSRDPELIHAIDRGDAFLTRLEGEWWIGLLLGY